MVMKFALLLTLCVSAFANSDDAKERPIAKVVRLLKDMQGQLQKEADQDADMYAEMQCWCETGGKDKALAIKNGEQRVRDLNAAIEEYASSSQQFTTDIENLKAQVQQSETSLAEATALRDKDLAEFVAEEKDMVQTITSLKGAVITLGRAHSEVQSSNSLLQVKNLLKHAHASKYQHMLLAALSTQQRHSVMSLIQETTSTSARTPASGEIFGVLKQMKESFENNLATSRKEEVQADTEYQQMKKAKTEEIAAGKNQIESKTVNLADSDEAGAQAAQDLKDTENALEADRGFLADLESRCATADQEYQARLKVRTEEIQAVSETMGILTSDEANDAFTTSMNFIQKSVSSKLLLRSARGRDTAEKFLKSASQKLNRPKLMTLAVSMRLDAFGKVIENIDSMVAALKEEQQDEVKDRDFCIEELNTNERQSAEAHDTKNDLDTKIADLTTTISELSDAIAALKDEVTTTQVAMKKATATREKANQEFQTTVSDQRATQAILAKALDRLKAFYEKKALLQENQPGQALAAPPQQATYAPNAGGGGVMVMIQDIVKESKEIESDAIRDEQDSQAAYEGFVKDSNKLITANTEDITHKTEHKAKADGDKAQSEASLKETINTILKLADMSQTIHGQCDFLLENFKERQSSRTQEMDALNQAKAIFSGMKF